MNALSDSIVVGTDFVQPPTSDGVENGSSSASDSMSEKQASVPDLNINAYLTEELLYFVMRGFGNVADMRFDKETSVWEIDFSRVSAAVSVRNCLHRSSVWGLVKSGYQM